MLGFALSKLGLLADAEGDYANAIRLHLEARELFARAGDQGGAGYTQSRASMSAYCLGDYEQAMEHALAGYEGFEQANHRWGMTAALCRLGFAAAALGRFDEARDHLRRALELAREMQATSLLLHALSGVGVLLAREGEDRRCSRGSVLLARARGHAGHVSAGGAADPRRARRRSSTPRSWRRRARRLPVWIWTSSCRRRSEIECGSRGRSRQYVQETFPHTRACQVLVARGWCSSAAAGVCAKRGRALRQQATRTG